MGASKEPLEEQEMGASKESLEEEEEDEVPLTPSKRASAVDENGCDHKDASTLVTYTHELHYFKKPYLDKNPRWPKECANCGKKFVDKPLSQIQEGDYKVTTRDPVYLCKHAADKRHPCVFGLCKGCKVETMGGSPTRRRTRRNLISHLTAAV
jgi:hypothetical protein